MRPKYGNSKIKNAYGTFDSQLELARFVFLSNRQKEGEISGLRRQVEYLLIPAQYGTEIILSKLLHTHLRVTLILDMVLSHFRMNDIIEPIEIGKMNSRYNKIKISEFDMVIPQRRNGA